MSALPPKSVALVFGTRPEAIKLRQITDLLGPAALLAYTGQHYDASLRDAVFADLGGPAADVVLEVGGRSRGQQIGLATSGLDQAFAERSPSVVVVQGDTNATLAGALAALANDIPIVHVEAGLRSFDRAMPEEHNRVMVDHLAELCCAPTADAAANLRAEGIPPSRIAVTGNTVVEAVQAMEPTASARAAVVRRFGLVPDGYVLATIHRPENTDDPVVLEALLGALGKLSLPVVLPLHPRARFRVETFGLAYLLDRLLVCEPLSPTTFLALAAEAALWISDSGGLQEEASVLGKPIIVPRRSTERPEIMGTFGELVGPDAVVERAEAWLGDPDRRRALAHLPSPYGDGGASAAIVELLTARFFGTTW